MEYRRPQYELKLVGMPSWEIELLHGIVKPSHGWNWAHNKIIICFKARFSLPPQDDPNSVVNIQRMISAPLHSLIDQSQSTFDLIDHMFESLLFPFFVTFAEQIIAGVNRIADTHRAELSAAATPVALRMNVNISTLLHQIPYMHVQYQGGELGRVTDLADLIDGNNNSGVCVTAIVIPRHQINLPYDQRERIFQRIVNFYRGLDDDDVVDPSILPIMFKPASKDSIESLEKVTIDVGSISMGNCSICMEDILVGTEATRLPCSHHYHPNCIVKWLEMSKFCPLCRFEIS